MKVPARIPDWLGCAANLESGLVADAINTDAEHEQDIREQVEIVRVRARLERISEQLDQLTDTQLDRAIGDAELFWDTYSPKTQRLRLQIDAVRLRRSGGDTHDQHTDQPAQNPCSVISIGGFR
jgi:hypothetical protein